MICQLCGEERKTQCSHDIPKYIGGTDEDGRHNLCIPCHKHYDKKLLKEFLKFIGEEFNESYEWRGIMNLQSNIKKETQIHSQLRKIAFKIKKEVFGDEESIQKI